LPEQTDGHRFPSGRGRALGGRAVLWPYSASASPATVAVPGLGAGPRATYWKNRPALWLRLVRSRPG